MPPSYILLALMTLLCVTTQTEAIKPLRIGSFNIRILGLRKMSKTSVMTDVVEILSKYDLVSVLEIRDTTEQVPILLLEALNKKAGSEKYGLMVSARLGHSNSKENYAFYYVKNLLTPVKAYQLADSSKKFERAPYSVLWEANEALTQEGLKRFVTVALHVDPDKAFEELSYLPRALGYIKRGLNNPDLIVLGDLNADCGYLSNTKRRKMPLFTSPRYTLLIPNGEDTTVSNSDCTYDHIILCSQQIARATDPESAGTYYFDKEMKLSTEEALAVSDHYPVEFTLGVEPSKTNQC